MPWSLWLTETESAKHNSPVPVAPSRHTLLPALQRSRSFSATSLPYHNNDAIKDVVWILDVTPDAKGQQFQEHLQGKHAGEDYVADLQGIGQFVWLHKSGRWGGGNKRKTRAAKEC